jgi:DNA gyrase inhibitor GyrI
MNDFTVQIVQLNPMRVASVHAFGVSPENDAKEKLISWAKPKGLLDSPEKFRIFGFNNPDPSPESPNYGYEFWITVKPDMERTDQIKMKDFPGGLYAVSRCEVKDPWRDIPKTWRQLAIWRENSRYEEANHQWLEENIGPIDISNEFILDLHLPIAE